MSEFYPDKVAPQLFECFIDRAQADLPDDFLSVAKGVAVAGPDLIRGLDDFSKSKHSTDWKPADEGAVFHRDWPDVTGGVLVNRIGEFWYIQRALVNECNRAEYDVLVIAFENVPICTRTHEEAIRLAEHCLPVPRWPMAGYWAKDY
jgi:hypothetical protein